MNNSSLLKSLLVAFSLAFMVSCDTDYNEIGSSVIDGDIHNNIIQYNPAIAAYDRATGSVQSNNLTVNSLGVLNNPIFGTTTASFVTQAELGTVNPTFDQPVLDSVYLYVPYYSVATGGDTEGTTTYELDSIYGDTVNKFRLSIKRNGFFLRDADAGTSGAQGQRYYSDDISLIDAQAGASLLAGDAESMEFAYSAAEIKRMARAPGATADKIAERLAPGMFIPLDVQLFEQLIIQQGGTGNLGNNNVFQNYFRGVYFKAEQIGDQAVMGMLNFAAGKITMRYRDVQRNADDGIVMDEDNPTVPAYVSKTLDINLIGNTINFFQNNYQPSYLSAIGASSPVNGDSRLYVKGGEGSVAFVDINTDEIESLRPINGGQKVLINEANLIFYIDQEAMGANTVHPLRLFLFDANNNRPVYDYSTDVTTLTGNTKYNKYVHGGILEYDTQGRPARYKIRITDHINNIVNKDSTNVKLGLSVTESINVTVNSALKTPVTAGTRQVRSVPSGAVMHPFGTILYGSTAAVPEDKRLKLEIFYTKPE